MNGPPVNETPAARQQILTKLDKDAEERLARKAGDKAYQCLITLEQNNFTITIAHVFDRQKIGEPERKRFEYLWGCEPNKFHSDTSANLVYLSVDVHCGFDNYGWAMLPELKYLNMIYDYFQPIVANLKKEPSSPSSDTSDEHPPSPFTYWKNFDWCIDEYVYYVVPLRWEIDGTVVTRSRLGPNLEIYYGGEGFPALTSWIHPFFAIWNAGSKLAYLMNAPSRRFQVLDMKDTILRALVLKAYDIWKLWTSCPLPTDYREPSREPSPTPMESANGYATRSSLSLQDYQSRHSGAGSLGVNPRKRTGGEGNEIEDGRAQKRNKASSSRA